MKVLPIVEQERERERERDLGGGEIREATVRLRASLAYLEHCSPNGGGGREDVQGHSG